jgi:hypothetical protein
MRDLIVRPEFDAKAFGQNKSYYHLQSLVYPWLGEILNLRSSVYFCPVYLAGALPKAMALLAFYTFTVFAASGLAGYHAGRRLFGIWRFAPLAACSLTFLGLAAIAFDTARDWDITYKGWTGLLMFGGCLLGEVAALAVARKKDSAPGTTRM